MIAFLQSRNSLLPLWKSEIFAGRRFLSKKNKARALPSQGQLAAAEYIAKEATRPIKELVTLRDVIFLLNKTNRAVLKQSILQQYAMPLKDILLFIYNPRVRLNVTPETALKYLDKRNSEGIYFPDIKLDSVLSLFTDLESREVVGNAALDEICSVLEMLAKEESRVKDDKIKLKASLQDVFLRCLDRNLRAGINYHTIQKVFGPDDNMKATLAKWPSTLKRARDEVHTSIKNATDFDTGSSDQKAEVENTNVKESEDQRDRIAKKSRVTSPPYGVALGKATALEDLQTLFKGDTTEESEDSWYLSRKLDGVRCVVRIDIDVSQGVKAPLKFVEVETMSRTERSFTSLDVLKEELATLLSTCPSVVSLLEKCYNRREANSSSSSSPVMSLYLDGELCALKPEMDKADGYTEDFSEIVGIVRRKSYTVPKPAYFPFDVLTEVEFRDWPLQENNIEEHDPFYLRKKRVDDLVDYCREQKSIVIRKLDQTLVKDHHQVLEASKEAAAKQWEGLILRKGNRYQGKRTTSIRKFKHWQEEEYVVRNVQMANMRLPVDQLYEDRKALASVSIDHHGTEVFVGSGFSVEERLRYAADPNLIIGKEITVQYFGESHSAGRASKEEMSLRFPRVKRVWEDGKRDI